MAAVAVFAGLAGSPRADGLPLDRGDQILGVANCSSRQCHGAVCSDDEGGPLYCEYRIWLDADPHSRAYRVLTEGEAGRTSERIVRLAGLGTNPAEVAACLQCHGTNVPPERRGETFQASEGVTCEACHGGASGWLASHKQRGTTATENQRNGLYPTDDVEKRAELCLSCHLGDEKRFVTHAMMAGGHPRLSFELATYTLTQPAHFRTDADGPGREGKSVATAANTWAVGQLVAARAYLDLLASRAQTPSRPWPELALYDCDSCHQAMTTPARPSLMPPGLGGFPRLDDESLRLASLALHAMGSPAAASLRDLGRDLQVASVKESLGTLATIAAHGSAVFGPAIASATDWHPSAAELRPLLRQIEAESAHEGLTYWRAQQRYAAAQAILATLHGADPLAGSSSATSASALARRLDPLYAAVRSESAFRASAFQQAFTRLASESP